MAYNNQISDKCDLCMLMHGPLSLESELQLSYLITS